MTLDIYAPVVHGIGVRDHKEFARDSVRVIADHLAHTSWHRRDCPTECTDFAEGHVHLGDAGGRTLVVDPITWFDEIREPSRWRAAWWFLRALFVLCAVHLLVNGHVLLQVPRLRGLPLYVWQAIRAMAWILLLGVGSLVLAIPLTLAVAFVPVARRLATDALGWTSDPETRLRVIERVTNRVLETGARHTVLIGHSQGGAIATTVSHLMDPSNTTLVTMGNGQALLAPIRASLGRVVFPGARADGSEARGVPWVSFASLIVAIVAYVGALLVILRIVFLGALELVSAIVIAAAHLVRAAFDPAIAPEHTAAAGSGIVDALRTLALSPGLLVLLLCVPIIAVTVLIYARLLAPAVRGMRELLRPAVPGVDLCARFDGVSHPFTVLGSPRRVVKITQSAALLDHMLYFDNVAEVLTEIERWITSAGATRTPDPRASQVRRRIRRLVRSLRVWRGALALAAVIVAYLAVPSALAATGAGVAVYAIMTFVKHRTWLTQQRALARA